MVRGPGVDPAPCQAVRGHRVGPAFVHPDWQLLTVEQVAAQLQTSRQAVWALARNGQIPVVRISPRRLRFEPDDVQRWIERRTSTRPRS